MTHNFDYVITIDAMGWKAAHACDERRPGSCSVQNCGSVPSYYRGVHNCLTNGRQFCTAGGDGGFGARTRSRGKDQRRFTPAAGGLRAGVYGAPRGARARARGAAQGDRGLRGLSRRRGPGAVYRGRERPQGGPAGAGKALHLAKVTGATLVIAKLDRVSRNAVFLLALRDSGVQFVAVHMPEANDLTVGIMALVAQAEREAISLRTIAKARGLKLGNPNGAECLRRAGKGGSALRAAVSANAEAFAADLAPVVADIRAAGHLSLRAIAAELTAHGIKKATGWPVGRGEYWSTPRTSLTTTAGVTSKVRTLMEVAFQCNEFLEER